MKLLIALFFFIPTLAISDMTAGSVSIGGYVPSVMYTEVTIFPNIIVYNKNQKVKDRLIGKIYFKYNTPLSAINLSTKYHPFPITLRIPNCPGIYETPIHPSIEPIKIGENTTLKSSVVTTCDILASWDGTDVTNSNIDYTITLTEL